MQTGRVREVACDTVVFTADWIPDHELAVMAGLELDHGTRGPAVDAALRTSRPGVFAAGNLLHGAEQADVAALSGRQAAAGVVRYLEDGEWSRRRVPIVCEERLGWIAPNVDAAGGGDAGARFLLRAHDFIRLPRVEVAQDGRVLWHGRLARLMPGRSTRLPHGWTNRVDAAGGEVRLRLRSPWRSVCGPPRRGYKPGVEHEEQAQEMERDVERMEHETERVGERIDETRQEWEAKEQDPSVPGAQPDSEEEEESVPGAEVDEERLSEEGGP